MNFRPAAHTDIDEIVAFTTDTFEWGDYVPLMIGDWVDDPSGVVMVAIDNDEIVGLARVILLSEIEAWSHAARVRPDRRGEGIAGMLADVLTEWARQQGALVIRLLIEDDNEASIRHIQKQGFRRVATAIRANRAIGDVTPNPDGNGGRRMPSALTAKPVKSADAPMLAAGWPMSQPGRELRGMIAQGWSFHTVTEPVLVQRADAGELWEMGSSWAATGPFGDGFDVSLIDTNPDEAFDAIKALIDLANERGADTFWMWVADIDWLVQAARRAGCETTPSGIWIHPL